MFLLKELKPGVPVYFIKRSFCPLRITWVLYYFGAEAEADSNTADSGHSPAYSGRLLVTVTIPPTALESNSEITSANHSDK